MSARVSHAPLMSRSVYNVACKCFSGVDINVEGKKQGAHSLRMSLATQWISENVPYAVVQKILGQESPESTKHYAKIDVEKLRLYAWDVPPSGLFAERLGIAEEGVL